MKNSDPTPQPIGSPLAAYDATHAVIAKIGAKNVLDCPAGKGAFAKQLLDAGYTVTCADIFPDEFELDMKCSFADLNDALPYGDDMFDLVTCQNGLHRIWARGRALRELARVTRPGGRVLFTFVNNNNLWRRLIFLFSGSVIHDINGPPHNFYPEAQVPAAQYRYPMSVAQVVSAMASVNLEIEGVVAFKWSLKSVLLAPLCVFPILFSLFPPQDYRKYGFLKQANSLPALFGDYLLVYGKKTAAR
jgi:ubiquinone/menaquinone biosynthesis C-methylase UbiE